MDFLKRFSDQQLMGFFLGGGLLLNIYLYNLFGVISGKNVFLYSLVFCGISFLIVSVKKYRTEEVNKIKYNLLSNFILFTYFCVLNLCILETGSSYSPTFYWLIAVPILSLFINNEKKFHFIWGAVFLINVLFFLLEGKNNIEMSSGDHSISIVFSLSILSLGFFTAIYKISEIQKDLYERKYEIEKKYLDEKFRQETSTLLNSIIHEINSPLTALYFGFDSIKMLKPEDKGIMEETLSNMEKTARNIDAIVKNFTPEKIKPKIESVDLNSLANEIKFMLNTRLNRKKIIFKTEVYSSKLETDPSLLFQVLSNIIKNAIEAFPEDWDNKKIILSSEVREGYIVLKISDNGKGIPEKIKSKIFETNFSTKGKDKGNKGLGLAISRKIIKKLDGVLDLEKQEVGTCFVVKLPIKN